MSDYEALERYNLSQHGDHWEKKLWDVVKTEFPAYQRFWRKYVVPLTNRVAETEHSSPEWIRLRPEIGNRLEHMTMHHYSSFYFLARARKRICENKPLPEDVFAPLDSCRENILKFFQTVTDIYTFSSPTLQLPTDESSLGKVCPTLDAIKDYRNVILHNPVLGRSTDRTREFLPKPEVFKRKENKIESSWREAAKLKPEEMINSLELYEQLYQGLTAFLEMKWDEIIGALDKSRESSKFKGIWMLDAYLPIKLPPFVVSSSGVATSSSCSPVAVSAVLMPRVEPT